MSALTSKGLPLQPFIGSNATVSGVAGRTLSREESIGAESGRTFGQATTAMSL